MQVKTSPEQEEPRGQWEVIRRKEAKGIKPQIGREVVGVEKTRQCDEPMAQLQIAIGCIAGEVKQKHAPCKADHRGHLFHPLFQQSCDDHSRAQQGQHTEPDRIRRHEDQRDRRDKCAAPKHHRASFDRVAAQRQTESGKKEAIERTAKELFIQSVHQTAELIAEQLYSRYQYQRTALARQFPFMMGNDVWKGGGKLAPNDQVGDVLRQGTLGIGFIGGHNAMMALYGESHGHSRKAWDTLYEAVLEMNKVADDYKAKYQLNFSVLATPAEGLSGRFTRMDRRKYGTIPGVTDNDYYVNSFHVDVKESITIVDKIKREAPFHAITRGGHITYVELDGEAQKNIKAIAKIVKVMHDEGIGYGSINHPVDTCHNCGYKGVIYDKCPVCQSENILRMRRITGYLTGDLSTWNSAKRAEERDRVKHG